MDEAHLVAVSDGVHDRSDSISGLLLSVGLLLNDTVEELAPGHELHNEVHVIRAVVDLKQSHEIRVIGL